MHIDGTFAIAVFMPLSFALVATALAWRTVANRYLYLVTMTLVFASLQEIAYAPLQDQTLHESDDIYRVMASETTHRFIADAVSAVIGGIVAWKLARALRPRSN